LPTLLAAGATYTVAVQAQPLGQTCTTRSETGTITSASVTTVQVSCIANTYAIGGIITGLNAGGLVLANGTDTLTVSAGATAYMMPTKQILGAMYDVTVQTQPAGLTCQVTNGSGTMAAAAVSNVDIVCGQWTWIDGASATGSAGSYGAQGLAATSNAPSARLGAVRWTDHAGHLWLFGGATSSGSLSDLWRFDPGSSQWTWIAGASSINAMGDYGTQGMEAAGNAPGARQGATGWVDVAGNLWLFGGQGVDGSGTSGSLDDLWKYDMGSGHWEWVAGEASAYAAGAAPPAGEPGARSGASSWVDASGNLWLFGGTGTTGPTNDLWEYAAGGAGWTLVSGSQTAAMNGVYGTEGTAAALNLPGSRTQASAFADSNGNLWLFGGQGYALVGGSGLLNDLWSFSTSSHQWTWMGGWKTVNATGVYVIKTAGTLNLPGARDAASVATDASGNLWLFGGTGYDGNGAQGALADLWEYQVSTSEWIWMGGSQTRASPGSYGTQGVGALGNTPGARAGGAAWMDTSGNFWLFGGAGLAMTSTAGPLNDLWQFVP
jgi:N-acetylneuraminic acid mutarotase